MPPTAIPAGNAALGALTVLVALAFLLPQGRRVPAGLLAACATAVLLGGLAASAIVLASLAGLREDHGQWTVVALALVGACLALSTIRARRLPRLLAVGLPMAIGAAMAVRAGWGASSDLAVLTGAADGDRSMARWDLALWSPFFAAWGATWMLAARAARRRRRRGDDVAGTVTVAVRR